MSAEIDFLPYATGGGANVPTQSAYAANAQLGIGQQPGIASSSFNNKALRQANFIASQLANLISNITGCDVLDDGLTANLVGKMTAALAPKYPNIQKFTTTGAGTYNRAYLFNIASGNATVGATYTNNAVTYTVVATVAASTQVYMTGSAAPAVTGASQTLTKASGTGDATITFYAVSIPLYLRVRMVGGGGGGTGSGSSGAGAGGTGGNTTLNTTLLVANGGTGAQTGGAGGSASLGTGTQGIALSGAPGSGGQTSGTSGTNLSGGGGAATPFAGGGGGASPGASPGAVIANTGVGGGGAGYTESGSGNSGGGGGAGGYVDAIIVNPASTYPLSIGTAGSAGTAGTGGAAGGVGATGFIEITEYYQ